MRGYSLGMRQRLALATLLVGDPAALILGKPANGLDPEGIAWLRGRLRDYARSGRTVLYSSHVLTASLAWAAGYSALAITLGRRPGGLTPPLAGAAGQHALFAIGAGGAAPLAAIIAAAGVAGEFRHRTAATSFLAAVIISAAVFGVTGAGLGALLGSEVITIAGLLLYFYVVEPLISHITALGSWTAYLLGVAADGLTQASQADARLLPPWQGGLVFAAWTAVIAWAGAVAVAVAPRDIT